MKLIEKRCLPCEGGTPPLAKPQIDVLSSEVPLWSLRDGHLFRSFKFRNFKEAMVFVNSLANLAEEEGHHPDICIHYNRVDVELWTHAIKGLSENDFIMAAKADNLIIGGPFLSR